MHSPNAPLLEALLPDVPPKNCRLHYALVAAHSVAPLAAHKRGQRRCRRRCENTSSAGDVLLAMVQCERGKVCSSSAQCGVVRVGQAGGALLAANIGRDAGGWRERNEGTGDVY